MKSVSELLAENGGTYTVAWEHSEHGPLRVRRPQPSTAYIADKLDGQYLWRCRNCAWHAFSETDEPLEHRCGDAKIVRLGDRVELALESVGITKDRWIALKAKIGLPATCDCPSRKKWLSDLDASLGLGERIQLFTTKLGWTK